MKIKLLKSVYIKAQLNSAGAEIEVDEHLGIELISTNRAVLIKEEVEQEEIKKKKKVKIKE